MGTQATVARWWSSDAVPEVDRTDAWQHVLSSSYRAWDVPQRLGTDFSARLRQVDLGGLKLIECVCSPCVGRRLPLQVKQDDTPHLGVQIVTAGAERFCVDNKTVAVGRGDALVWLSDRAMEFEVTERLHKVTLMVPLHLLKERMSNGSVIRAGVIDGRHGLGAILFSHVRALAKQLETLGPGEVAAARRATLELLSALSSRDAASVSLAQQYLRRVQEYILDHLQEEDLTPARIARANHISVRYLHLLFQQIGQSVSRWIQAQRLQRCRDCLADPAFSSSKLADIAWRWGFKDSSHFSRAFKAHFGRSPSSCRCVTSP